MTARGESAAPASGSTAATAEPAVLPRTVRFDQVGSLIRPKTLVQAFDRVGWHAEPDAALLRAQDDAMRTVIERQAGLGLPILTDGEFRRAHFSEGFSRSVSGLEFWSGPGEPSTEDERKLQVFGSAAEQFRFARNQPLAEWRAAQALTDRLVKATIVSSGQVARRVGLGTAYASAGEDALADDATDVLCQIVGGLSAAGCRYVQVDAPPYTEYVDATYVEQARTRGEDLRSRLEKDIARDNRIARSIGPGTVKATHLCRGARVNPQLVRRGGYDAISERIFSTLEFDRFLLEYDTERAGGFEPLRFVPKGKVVVLGLVSTKVPELENEDELVRRIEDASRYLPIEQLAISPQCGFATSMTDRERVVTEDIQWRKLELTARVAERVWPHDA